MRRVAIVIIVINAPWLAQFQSIDYKLSLKLCVKYNNCPICEQLLEFYAGEKLGVIILIRLTSNIVELVPSRILKKVKVLDNERPYMTISKNDKVAILFEID